MINRRPYPSLVYVAAALRAGHRQSDVIRTFLTYLDSGNICESLEREPTLLRDCCPMGEYFDAYLAAVAEHMAMKFGEPVPEWAYRPERFLASPPPPAKGMESLHQLLQAETPEAFLKRGIVVSSNALEVA